MEVHFFAPAALTRAVLPHMRRQHSGAIVQISSMGGRMSFAGVGAYSATKFALEGLSEALAAEVAPFGIKVLIVEPGAFRTGLHPAPAPGRKPRRSPPTTTSSARSAPSKPASTASSPATRPRPPPPSSPRSTRTTRPCACRWATTPPTRSQPASATPAPSSPPGNQSPGAPTSINDLTPALQQPGRSKSQDLHPQVLTISHHDRPQHGANSRVDDGAPGGSRTAVSDCSQGPPLLVAVGLKLSPVERRVCSKPAGPREVIHPG